MKNLVCSEVPKKSQLSSQQKTFNRLTKKIKILQSHLENTEEELDLVLHFYHHNVRPAKTLLVKTLNEFVTILYGYYQQPKLFSKKDRQAIKEFLLDQGEIIMSLNSYHELDPAILSILEELKGVKTNEIISTAMTNLKTDFATMCEELGLEVDLSQVDSSDDEATIIRKLFQAVQAARENQQDKQKEHLAGAKPKSKRELQKEMKQKELEALQKKGLGTVYKQLAKTLHPDLEQDPTLKSKKEKIMKRLTSAYENNDLHELLSIEIDWMGQTENAGGQEKMQSDEQLKIYNSILKDQITDLELKLEMSHLNPKYISISNYVAQGIPDGLFKMKRLIEGIKKDLTHFRKAINDLHAPNAIDIIRTNICM